MAFVVPAAAAAQTRLSRSTVNASGAVEQTASSLLAQAQAVMPGIALETYALARVIASEFGNGTPQEQLAIAVADVRRARGGVYLHTIGKAGTFGRQGAQRPVATSQDPTLAHAQIAAQALAGVGAEDYGAAIQYFDAVSQLSLWQRGKALHPSVVLEMWHYNKRPTARTVDTAGRQVATLGPSPGGGVQWIGPRAGVRPERLMLFEGMRTSSERDARFTAARQALAAVVGATSGLVGALVAVGLFALARS